jgi:hypothetical protein
MSEGKLQVSGAETEGRHAEATDNKLLTPWSKVLPEKITGPQSRNFPHFVGSEGPLPVTGARNLPLS